jgi:hypothetical protein
LSVNERLGDICGLGGIILILDNTVGKSSGILELSVSDEEFFFLFLQLLKMNYFSES